MTFNASNYEKFNEHDFTDSDIYGLSYSYTDNKMQILIMDHKIEYSNLRKRMFYFSGVRDISLPNHLPYDSAFQINSFNTKKVDGIALETVITLKDGESIVINYFEVILSK